MKAKVIKFSVTLIFLAVCFMLYKLPVISSWRKYNNGIRSFTEKNYEHAATEFNEAITLSDDPILKYNRSISLWSDVMKRQKDLKINSIMDSSLTETAKKELSLKIEQTQTALNEILSDPQLDSIFLAKLYYARGKLFLLTNQPEAARQAFINSTSKDKNFKAPLVEVVKLKTSEEFNPTDALLLNTSEPEPIELIKDWKPF